MTQDLRLSTVLVTGGAGYVGSIVAEELLKKGYQVVILDNLQQGHREAVPSGAEFIPGDICDPKALDELFQRFKIEAVMHMAAETVIEYSLTDPKRYFHTNIVGGVNLLDTMLKYQVYKFIFSSSAAVYGQPQTFPIEEDHPKNPINAYGESKLMFERILDWYGRAYGIKHISLRYFNAAGATELLGEYHHPETHLIPNVLKAALTEGSRFKVQGSGLGRENIERGTLNVEPIKVFGADYPTKDGSCIRDYIHVIDIARAHVLALQKVEKLNGRAYNLGNGEGHSVLEVVETAKRVTGNNIPVEVSPRRPGDPAVLVASSEKAKSELGWRPEFPELESIIESAWRWMKEHPEGYGGREQRSK